MKNVYFFTGFPGFLTSYLLKEIIEQGLPVEKIYLLTLPSMKEESEQRIKELADSLHFPLERFELVQGDITKKQLDLDPTTSHKLLSSITHAFHLAAIYDLSVPLKPAYQVNVKGTQCVNDWLLQAEQLKHYVYFSTAYVSGKRTGTIYENELTHEFGFKNYYEATKYEAEKLVYHQFGSLPITILRPGIVVGHSKTGETAKFDGPYFLLHLFDRLKFLGSIPYFGKGDVEANFVPVDYVVQSTVHLAHTEEAIGKTFHLTDPDPYKSKDVYRMLMEAYLGQSPSYTIPIRSAQLSLNMMPIRRWLHIPKQTLPYFAHDCHYDTTNADKLLSQQQIQCPDFQQVIPSMIQFYQEHKHDLAKQIHVS
ncbi:SDR family oxidoreductase [Pontibacillus salicampi]|uniref:SDR family oxidoreductase n=1 Tax=Pontibacillus salicampi TaxID=1449801 RepID=A0ABV6LMS9_9BACI